MGWKTTEELLADYKKKKERNKYEGTTPGHTETDKLLKQSGKKTLMQRLSDQRKANAAEKAKFQAAYREEFDKQRMASLKARAKQEAMDKYRPTRKQKMDRFANAIGGLGGAPQIKRKTIPSKQKSKGKQKFTVIGGRAYPIAKQHQQSRTQHKKKKKRTSSDPFDLGGLDDIGDFNF